jgi:hypothetical protein
MVDSNLAAQFDSLIAPSLQPAADLQQRKEKQIIRRKFTPEEDDVLRRIVARLGSNDWNAVAQQFPNRSPRQCRDRWRNYLSPDVAIGPWSRADEETLLAKVKEMGPRWALIAQQFPGRTDIGVKNHYISITAKQEKERPMNG